MVIAACPLALRFMRVHKTEQNRTEIHKANQINKTGIRHQWVGTIKVASELQDTSRQQSYMAEKTVKVSHKPITQINYVEEVKTTKIHISKATKVNRILQN